MSEVPQPAQSRARESPAAASGIPLFLNREGEQIYPSAVAASSRTGKLGLSRLDAPPSGRYVPAPAQGAAWPRARSWINTTIPNFLPVPRTWRLLPVGLLPRRRRTCSRRRKERPAPRSKRRPRTAARPAAPPTNRRPSATTNRRRGSRAGWLPDAPPPPGGPAPSVKPEITPPPALPEPAVLRVEKAPPDPKLVATLRCLLEKHSADTLELLPKLRRRQP